MDKPGFTRRSCTSTPASRWREALLTVGGLTAGGSGRKSTEAIANNRPTAQIVQGLDFMPSLHQELMIPESPPLYFCEATRHSFGVARRILHGCEPAFY